jgi:hypothetical protein
LRVTRFCDKIGNWVNEIVSWAPGDNGMPIKASSLKHIAEYDTELELGVEQFKPEHNMQKQGGIRNKVKKMFA